MYRELLEKFVDTVKDLSPDEIEKVSEDILEDMSKIAMAAGNSKVAKGLLGDLLETVSKRRYIKKKNLATARRYGVKGLSRSRAAAGEQLFGLEKKHLSEVDKLNKEIKKMKNGNLPGTKEYNKMQESVKKAQAEVTKKDLELLKQKNDLANAKTQTQVAMGAAGLAGAGAIAAASKNQGYMQASKDANKTSQQPVINKY